MRFLPLQRFESDSDYIEFVAKGADRLFEGDPAPTQPFEELVSVDGNVLGEAGAAGLVPWLKKSSSDYLIIISDPRVKSEELRDTVKNLSNEMPKDMLSRTVIINADTPPENRRWLKKNKIKNINFYSDEERELMRSYTALGENRWSMTMFVIADSRVQKIARELETIMANKVIQNAVRSMENRRL